MNLMNTRYTVVDSLKAQNLDLIPRNDQRRRTRYWVWDTVENTAVDEFASKRAAEGTAKDMSAKATMMANNHQEDAAMPTATQDKPLTKAEKDAAREQARQEKEAAERNSENPRVAFLKSERDSLLASIAPQEQQIREIEQAIASVRNEVAMLDDAIRILSGEGPAVRPLPQRRQRRSSSESGTTPASAIDRDAIASFIANSDEPVGATDIRKEFGYEGQGLSLVLKEMVDEGRLAKQGEKRGTKYSIA